MAGTLENSTIATALLPIFKDRRAAVGFAQQKETGGYRAVTWPDYYATTLRLSEYLRRAGIKAGDRVLLLSENCPEWGMAAYATFNLGATLVPVAAMSTQQELEAILAKSGAKFCFFSRTVAAYKFIDKQKLPPHFTWDIQALAPLAAILAELPLAPVNPNRIDSEAVALLIYTSGTTGNPKAVPLTHRNVLINMEDAVEAVSASDSDVVVSVLPMSHMFEFTGGLLLCSYVGVKVVYAKSLRAEDILGAMRDHGCTVLIAVPLLFEVIARNMEQKLSSLPGPFAAFFALARKIVARHAWLRKPLLYPIHKALGGKIRYFLAGGAKLQPWVYEFFKSVGIPVIQGYGLTETSPVLAVSNLVNSGPNHVGKPFRRIELGIFNDKGERIDGSQEGEIWARGPSVFRGYENPEHNATAFSGGWFRTGDLGRFTKDGCVEITGRKKDLIVTPGGKNVYPEELEAALARTGKFLEVCVLGIQDDQGHEKVTAVVRPDRSKLRVDAGALQATVEREVHEALKIFSDYMQPQRVLVMEQEFPKTHTRKVRRFELRERLLALGERSAKPAVAADDTLDAQNSLQQILGEAISAITHKPFAEIRRGDRLSANLGLDSLTFVEILCTVERKFMLKAETLEFASVETVDDLILRIELLLAEQGKSAAVARRAPFFTEFPPLAGMDARWRVPRMLLSGMIRLLLKIYNRVASVDRGNIGRASGPLVFVANHTSHFDSLAIVSTLPYGYVRKTFAVAAKDYFFGSAGKAFLARLFLNAIPFDRKKRVDEGMRKCREILEGGGSLLIFPEGTRSPTGVLQPFKPGVGTLLCGNPGARAVPVYIDGAYEVFPKGGRIPRPKKLRVIYGEPISFAELAPTSENYATVAQRLQAEVERLGASLPPTSRAHTAMYSNFTGV